LYPSKGIAIVVTQISIDPVDGYPNRTLPPPHCVPHPKTEPDERFRVHHSGIMVNDAAAKPQKSKKPGFATGRFSYG
jgi:hypothetical protein